MPGGHLALIVGPMFAGKSTELMRRVKRELHARKSCFVIKYKADTRYSEDMMATHDKQTLEVDAAVSRLEDVGQAWKAFDVVAIDEGQFFPDIVTFCSAAADAGKTVYVSALDGDFRRKPFGKICELVPHCNEVVKLNAVCMLCHSEEASFTRRTVSGEQTELIGGAEAYIATCRQCYLCPDNPTPRKLKVVQDVFDEVARVCGKKTAHTDAPLEGNTSTVVGGDSPEGAPPATPNQRDSVVDDDAPAAKKARLSV